MMRSPAALLLLVCLALTACATIIHEKKQKVTINTVPAGATLTIDGSSYLTPATVALTGKSEYYFNITKPGYEPATGKVDSEFRVWSSVVGNIFNLTGIIGFAVDMWGTGNAYELQKDNTVSLTALPVSTMYPSVQPAYDQNGNMVPLAPAYAAPAPTYSYPAPAAATPVAPIAPLPYSAPAPTGY